VTRTIKRDIADIVDPNTLAKAGTAINRAQEIASGYSSSMEVFKRAFGHSALHEALQKHTRIQATIADILPRTRLDSLYAAMNEALSPPAINTFEKLFQQSHTFSDIFSQQNQAFENLGRAMSIAHEWSFPTSIQTVLGGNLSAFSNSFSSPAFTSLLDELRLYEEYVADIENEEATSAPLDTILERLEASAPTDLPAPKSISEQWHQIDRMFTYLGVILTILGLIYAIQQSHQADERYLQIINMLDKQLHATNMLLQQYGEEKSHKITYTVTRATPVCSEQKFCTHEIMKLHPTQKVEALDFDRKWVLIEAYDALSEKIHRGWVLKKYMRLDRTSAEYIPTKAKDVEIDFNFDNLND